MGSAEGMRCEYEAGFRHRRGRASPADRTMTSGEKLLADARTTVFDGLLDPIAGIDNVLKEVVGDPNIELN